MRKLLSNKRRRQNKEPSQELYEPYYYDEITAHQDEQAPQAANYPEQNPSGHNEYSYPQQAFAQHPHAGHAPAEYLQTQHPHDYYPQQHYGQPQANTQNYLTVHALEKSFNNRPVVRGVSLNVARGEAVGLFGPNGAGKTTVFYMITGLIPPDRGKILIDGHNITQFPMYRRARLGIGYLPQESSIFRGLSVEENIMAILELTEPKKRKRKERLESLLEEFGITHVRKSPAIALSGGERRRVEIARALASQPSYILLDEPFAGIDPKTVGEIAMLIRHLLNRGIGVLITEHDVRSALEITNRAYIIHDGQVLMEGTPEQVINNPDVRKYYLGNEFL